VKRLVQPSSLGTPEQTDHALKVVQFVRHGSASDEDVGVGTSFDDGLVDFGVLVLRLVSFIDDDAIERADQLVLVVGHAPLVHFLDDFVVRVFAVGFVIERVWVLVGHLALLDLQCSVCERAN
jgi:hypothetical protein